MVARAIDYEERRQTAILGVGGRIAAETRLWNDEKGETRTLRSKETAADYRYFPEPDLPPLVLDADFVAAERRALPELPLARRARYAQHFGLPEHDVLALTQEPDVGVWFEALAASCGDAKPAANWVQAEVLPRCRALALPIDAFPVQPARLGELLRAVDAGTVGSTAAKKVLDRMLATGEPAAAAVQALGLQRIDDPDSLEPLARAAIAALPEAAAAVRQGRQKALDALLGHVMRATRGKADPAALQALFARLLGN